MATRPSARSYSARTLKILWGRSAGRCAMPQCRIELLMDDSEYDPVVIIGDIAHVEASRDSGPRGNQGKPIGNRDTYENLILLCKNCHAKIDGQKKKFTVDEIVRIKAEHETWVRASLPERGQSNIGWAAIILQGNQPIDTERAIDALSPDFCDGNPYIINVRSQKEDWKKLNADIQSSVQAMIGQNDTFTKRFCVFPLAPVSACAALGYYLTDRPRVKLFQYHRHTQSWQWEVTRKSKTKVSVAGLPAKTKRKSGDVLICFELSAQIIKGHIDSVVRNAIGTVSVRLDRPSTSWLRSVDQLEDLGRIAQETFETIHNRFPNATCWHLFLATPAPVAVRIGQAMNPSMTRPVQLYEFNQCSIPTYIPSIRLGGGIS
jgi:hypothetical protein